MFGGGDDDDRPNPIVLLAASILAPIAAGLLQMALSRSREFDADRGGAELLGTGQPLATALRAHRDHGQAGPDAGQPVPGLGMDPQPAGRGAEAQAAARTWPGCSPPTRRPRSASPASGPWATTTSTEPSAASLVQADPEGASRIRRTAASRSSRSRSSAADHGDMADLALRPLAPCRSGAGGRRAPPGSRPGSGSVPMTFTIAAGARTLDVAERPAQDGPQVLLELAGRRALDRPVTGVVDPRCELVGEQPAVDLEQLERQHARRGRDPP